MTTTLHITKLAAALRQLDTAIAMLFSGADEIAVHTLVGAASILLTDLIEHKAPTKSWDRQAQEANNLSPSQYFQVMRKAQNFFKHASTDRDAELEFDPVDTESIAFWAVMNASELASMSVEAQVFQLWYIASHSPMEDATATPLREAIRLFGDLRQLKRPARLEVGATVLRERRAQNAA